MHQIAAELPEHDHFFTPYYGNTDFELLKKLGFLESTIGGNKLVGRCLRYLHEHRLTIDYGGYANPDVDLVVHCSDLVYPDNIRGKKVVLVQEGMTDPESVLYPVIRRVPRFPRWLAGTSATGLSHGYDRFCVASEGFRDLFALRGVAPESLRVTGIPNFDDCERWLRDNDFPHQGFVLCCTSDVREVFWWEDRRAFIEQARRIAAGRKLIFKLHPNERLRRAVSEVRRHAPGALVFQEGSAEKMIAKCDVLVCKYSSVAFVGLALGKEVHSLYSNDVLRRLLPLQNRCAARNIADVVRELLEERLVRRAPQTSMFGRRST
jgi:hypothetical protein